MLDRIVSDYSKLRKKVFEFELESGVIIDLKFKSCNLPHLIGLGKLKEDDDTINEFIEKRISAKRIMMQLKSEGKTHKILVSYPSWNGHLTRRMSEFTFENINMLIRQSAVLEFLFIEGQTKNDKAKFIFYTETETLHLHLMIGKDESNNFYFPNSFNAEFEKDTQCGKPHKIKVRRTKIYDGKVIEIIEHDKVKIVIRSLRSKMKEINKLNMNRKLIEKNTEKSETEKDNKLKLYKLISLNITNIRTDFEIVNKYIPLKDFFRIKSNIKIRKFYENMKNGGYEV